LNRVDQITNDVARKIRETGLDTTRHTKLAKAENLLSGLWVNEARAQSKQKDTKNFDQGQHVRTMYEQTYQKRDKIALIQNIYYALCFLGALLIVGSVFKDALVELVKMYVPAILASWVTFIGTLTL
jgi:hypothetical protein